MTAPAHGRFGPPVCRRGPAYHRPWPSSSFWRQGRGGPAGPLRGLLALALLGWAVAFLRCVARQVVSFTDELCRTLDGMLDRSARPAPAAPAETLSARLHHRLERLYHTMEANRQAVEREKASLETLISNIAHQVRTPVANLRMLYDTLLARPVPWAQQRQFLQAAQGQLDKLDFLLQALVKTSRLETGLITLESGTARWPTPWPLP